jgi:hypothetical protein
MPPGTVLATAGHSTSMRSSGSATPIRSRSRIPTAPARSPSPRQLGCSTSVIYHWIHTGQLTARRGSAGRFCIPWNAQAEAGCRTRIAQSAHLGRAARPRTLPAPAFPAAGGGEVSVTEAACQLGCSASVIYYWIETGQLTTRRGAGNRLHIPWNDQIQAECRSRIGQSRHLNPAARRTKPRRRR